jgi:ABC-2 type transport system ATP-binding protein
VLGHQRHHLDLGGGVIGLLGPNGAGKSTLMKLMSRPPAPQPRHDQGVRRRSVRRSAVRRRIGYSPEHESTYDELTGRELVTVRWRTWPASRAPRPARRGGGARGDGHAGRDGSRVAGYSKGMRQRTKLAATLAHDPDLLILDEPLTGVDPIARAEIIDQDPQARKAGKTVVVSSHVLYEIEALTQTSWSSTAARCWPRATSTRSGG